MSEYPSEGDLPQTFAPKAFQPEVAIDQNFVRSQADFHFSKAEALSLEGKATKAAEEFKSALIYDPRSPLLLSRYAVELVKTGQTANALERAKEAIEVDPNHFESRLILGALYAALQMFPESVAQYEAAVQLKPDLAEPKLYLGASHAENKNFRAANATFEKVLESPQGEYDFLAHYYIGRLEIEKRKDQAGIRFDKARHHLGKALELNPDFDEAVLAYVETFDREERPESSIEFLKQHQLQHGPTATVSEKLFQFYWVQKRSKEALEQINYLIALNPKNISALMKRSIVLVDLGKMEQAEADLRLVLEMGPDLDRVRHLLASVLEEGRKLEQAIAEYSLVPERSDFYWDAQVRRAFLLRKTGKKREASLGLEKLIANEPPNLQVYTLLASFHEEDKNYSRATQVLRRALEKHAEEPDLWFLLGALYDKASDTKNMEFHLRKAIELDPSHAQALNHLAYSFAEKKINLDEAESLVKRALEQDPEDGYIIDTLGFVLFQKGQVLDAVAVLELAHAKAPNESIIAEHLADAYLLAELPMKAREMYKKAVELAKSKERLFELRDKINASADQLEPREREPASASSE